MAHHAMAGGGGIVFHQGSLGRVMAVFDTVLLKYNETRYNSFISV